MVKPHFVHIWSSAWLLLGMIRPVHKHDFVSWLDFLHFSRYQKVLFVFTQKHGKRAKIKFLCPVHVKIWNFGIFPIIFTNSMTSFFEILPKNDVTFRKNPDKIFTWTPQIFDLLILFFGKKMYHFFAKKVLPDLKPNNDYIFGFFDILLGNYKKYILVATEMLKI